MNKSTIQSVIQAATKNKAISVNQIKKFADNKYSELGISKKALNQYLYSEYYSEDKLYSSCEAINKIY